MIATVSVFDSVKLRQLWFDAYGLLKASTRTNRGATRPRRKLKFTALIGAALIATSAPAIAAQPPGQATFLWPSVATEASIRQRLADAIYQIRQLKAAWTNRDTPAPIERSISAAQYILPQLPAISGDASAGVDDEGNVFFKFTQGEKIAFVTIEPKLVHLLYMEPGKGNIYKDDEPFNGKILPHSIKKVLENLKS